MRRETQAISVMNIKTAAADLTLLSYKCPVMSGSVKSPVFLTFFARNNPRTIRPSAPAISYHNAGSPWAYMRPPATIVADPPTAVAVIVAVIGNQLRRLSARKKPFADLTFLDEYKPIPINNER